MRRLVNLGLSDEKWGHYRPQANHDPFKIQSALWKYRHELIILQCEMPSHPVRALEVVQGCHSRFTRLRPGLQAEVIGDLSLAQF